jgi:stage II sporulation protein D
MQNRDPSVNWRLSDSKANLPKLPERLEIGKNGVPTLSVYDVSEKKASEMDIESYVMGVVAGEMKNDWPLEALKAQAILARTFVLKFCQDKTSKYDGADISTDVAEAQAYAPNSVNARVRQAVDETRGMALSWQGEFPNAWFHAHSGGMTELPSVALEYKGGDPEYLKPAASEESDRAPDNVKAWTATFTRAQVAKACADTGVRVGEVKTVELGEKGESGRARAILINGEAVSAPSFRLQIGANRLKSTLIDSVTLEGDAVTFSGRGFGHGVGLSQWGAYQMAEEGRTAQQILQRYFPGVGIAELW